MTAVIYARFSSDHQTEMSIDAQVRACQEYAFKKNIIITDVYTDLAISGTTANRAGYQALLADAGKGKFDMILIHKYDRIARSLSEQVSLDEYLKQSKVQLIAVAQDYGVGKDADLTKGIQWVLGGYYSANLSEEVKKGHKEIALKGLHNGGYAPFGYDIVDRKYVINELEAAFVRRMFSDYIEGISFKSLIEEMQEAGITGKRGKPIKYTQIYEILNNEKYTGTYVYSVDEETNRNYRRNKPNAIRVENAIPIIIDKDTFDKAQIILRSRRHAGKQQHKCSGLVYCNNCGSKMHILRSERKGHRYVNFMCSAHCGEHLVPVSFVEDAVDAYINEFFTEENIKALDKYLSTLKSENGVRTKSFEQEKQQKLDKLRKEQSNLISALASGAFADNYNLINDQISSKQREIENITKLTLEVPSDKQIRNWVSMVKKSESTPKAFIKRIIASRENIIIESSFEDVVSNPGCGDPHQINITTESEESVVGTLGSEPPQPRILTTFRFKNLKY